MTSRFLRQDTKEKKKLRARHYNRTQRTKLCKKNGAKAKTKKRKATTETEKTRNSTSRSHHCPCCNKRSNSCNMNFSDVQPYFAKAEFTRCAKRVKNSCLMSAGDTADGAAWIAQVKENKNKWDWPLAWGTSSIVRYFNNPQLTAILFQKNALRIGKVPAWKSIEKIIAERYAAKKKCSGASTTLQ